MPSIFSVKNFLSVVFRFPFEILASVIFTIFGIWQLQNDFSNSHEYVLLSIVLTYSLFLLGSVLAEKYNASFYWKHWVWIIFTFCIGGLSAFTLWNISTDFGFLFLQYFIWIASILCIAMAFLYNPQHSPYSHWKACENILFAIGFSVFFGLVAFLGTLVFLYALDTLFAVSLPNNFFGYAWFTITGMLCSPIFLSLFPKKDEYTLENKPSFIIKIFSWYILLPISGAYLILLYAYTAKMIITQTIPNGFLASFIGGFSIVIFFTVFQLFPFRSDHRFIDRFCTIAMWLLVPQAFIMLWSFYLRIQEYGITEPRYFGIIFSIFIILAALWWGFSKKYTLQYPLIFLATLFTIGSFGPWGAESVSLISQSNRLKEMLRPHGLIQENTLIAASPSVEYEDGEREEILNIISFFAQHGNRIQNNTIPGLIFSKEVSNNSTSYMKTMNALGKELNISVSSHNEISVFYKAIIAQPIYSLQNFTSFIPLGDVFTEKDAYNSNNNTEKYIKKENGLFFLTPLSNNSLRIDITDYIHSLEKLDSVPTPFAPFVFENDTIRLEMHIISININKNIKSIIDSILIQQGFLFYSIK